MKGKVEQTDFERLIQSVKAGNVEAIDSIIKSNPSVLNDVDRDGCNIMHYAANYKQADIFTALAQRDNSLMNKCNKYNISPFVACLIQMSKKDDFELAEFLFVNYPNELDEALKVLDNVQYKGEEIGIALDITHSTTALNADNSNFISLADATSIQIFQYFIGEGVTSKQRLDSWVANVQELMKNSCSNKEL